MKKMKKIVMFVALFSVALVFALSVGKTSAKAASVNDAKSLGAWIESNGGDWAIVDSNTIKLTKDVSSSDTLSVVGSSDAKPTVNLDLNGHNICLYNTSWYSIYVSNATLNITDSSSTGYIKNFTTDLFYASSKATITCSNTKLLSGGRSIAHGYGTGEITFNNCSCEANNSYSAFIAEANTTIKASDCTISNGNPSSYSLIRATGTDATIELKNCAVRTSTYVSDATITVPACLCEADTATLTIDGGTVDSLFGVKASKGTVNIKGGAKILGSASTPLSVGLQAIDGATVNLETCTIEGKKSVIDGNITIGDKYIKQEYSSDETGIKGVKVIAKPDIPALSNKEATYSGKDLTPAVTIKDLEGNALKEGKDYSLTWSNKSIVNAGQYTLVVKYIGDYATVPEARATFTIKKQTQTITATSVKRKVSYKKLKRSKKTVAGITVNNAKTKLVYKKISGSKKLTVNATTGKVSVKKKTKKGTYKCKVRVYASEGQNYTKSPAKTATVTVKVK